MCTVPSQVRIGHSIPGTGVADVWLGDKTCGLGAELRFSRLWTLMLIIMFESPLGPQHSIYEMTVWYSTKDSKIKVKLNSPEIYSAKTVSKSLWIFSKWNHPDCIISHLFLWERMTYFHKLKQNLYLLQDSGRPGIHFRDIEHGNNQLSFPYS